MSVPTPGRWPVVLSTRACGELRLLAEDKRTWDIIRKKLRELSHGQFTTDNYYLVHGTNHYIPIYRARLSNDLRIIYRIDLESDGYNNYDQQIIRVLTVRSRARVAYDFWYKVSKFLLRRGSEYRKRCIRRDKSDTKDGTIYVPASFPHKAYNSLADPDPESEDGDFSWEESEMGELHEAVVLEKYIPVTKALYNSILADMDTVLPIILNADEKAIVRYHGTSVVIGRSGTGKTTALVYKMRANALAAGISDHPGSIRQLFVTRSPVLTRRVAAYYKGLIESGQMAHKSSEELWAMRESNQKDQPRDILEFDNEADLRDDLPDRYSELKENHFPLFISFDRLGKLLEADALGTDDALALALNKRKRFINFTTFKHHYWPKFDYNLTRKLNPALVFSEILGVIKGYGRNLTENEYLNGLSTKKSPLLSNVRREVYTIFKQYQKYCGTRGETDAADRVRAILSARKDGTNIGSGVDYLFVDEVQDQLMADIHLLQSLCSNIDGGYWCGDTAQTINIGSSFRIKDMKAYLYGEMVSGPSSTPHGFRRKIASPFSTFELTVNFRSHSGIVKYAASLVQLLYTLFPDSIDHMQPESAPIPGPKPLAFISPSWDEDLFVEYLLGGKPVDQCPPFGSEQAIIVRSEATAHSLRVKLQNRCNVLTLFESKGLEFDDLILYGFFTESDVSFSAWKMIAGLESYQENGDTRFSKPMDLTLVSPGLCLELKQLYVAVTRARHHCWLWDSGPAVEMMKGFWQDLGLIKVSDTMETLSLFAGASDDPRQWAQRGEGFFSNGLYAIAQTCFERAGRKKEAQIADAYNHMSEAGKLQEDTPAAKSAQLVAAEKMIACTKLHSSHSSATLWYHAATCFEAAKDIHQASRAYAEGKFYDRAVLVYFEAQDMLMCLKIITSYYEHIDEALLRRIKEVASVHFLRQQDYSRLKLLYNGNLGECIEVARSLRFKAQLKELLQMAQQFEDLATEYLSDGSPAEAVGCLVHSSRTPAAIERAKRIISVFFWANFGLGDPPGSKVINQANLLLKICNMQDALSDSEGLQDVKLFEAIISQDRISLDMFNSILTGLNRESKYYCPRVVVLQYHVLKGTDLTSYLSHNTFLAYLKIWSAYNAHLQQFKALKSPSQDVGVNRLLGLSNPSNTGTSEVTIPNGSPLYDSINKSHGGRPGERTTHLGITVHFGTADMHIQTAFASRVKREIVSLSSNLLRSHRTQLVPLLPVSRGDGSSFEDVVISILHILPTLDSAMDRERSSSASAFTQADEEKIRAAWATRIFSTLFSSNGSFGGELNSILPVTSGDPSDATPFHTWINKTLQPLDPLEHKLTFVTLLVVCVALISELPAEDASFATIPHLKFKKYSSMPRGCPKEPDRFTKDIISFFQRNSPWRIINMNKSLQRMLYHSWFIDITVLVHLVEQTTREVMLSERAYIEWYFGGFSGLIAPRSWATNLVTHSAQGEHAYTLKPNSLNDFVTCVKEVLFKISSGIPENWNILSTHDGGGKYHSGLIALRLLWSIMFIMVNLHPGHGSVSFILDILNQAIARIFTYRNYFTEGFETLGFSISRLPRIITSQTCLRALLQIYPHEGIVMLQGRRAGIRPEARLMNGRIIKFDTLTELRNALMRDFQPYSESQVVEPALMGVHKPEPELPRIVTNSTPVPSKESTASRLAEPFLDEFEPIQVVPMVPPPRPDTPTSVAESEDEPLDDRDNGTSLTPEEAALRIFNAWKRSVKRQEQRQRLSDFDHGGQLYEQNCQHFPRVGIKTAKRDQLSLKLIRGPCINIVMGLQLLVKEVDAYMEALDEEIHAPELATAQLASIQESIKTRKNKAKGYKDKIFACCPSDSPPKLLIAKNLAGVKTQTKQAWDAFMVVKNSQILQKLDTFKGIEALVSNGRNLVLDATKAYR